MMHAVADQQMLYFNGLDATTGSYALPPMSGNDLARFIQGTEAPDNLNELRFRYQQSQQKHLGVKEGVDPKNLAETGWGVIFAYDANPAIKEALGELLALREQQAGAYFKIYEGVDGYRPGEQKPHFLARHGSGPGPADPAKVPYYLLIVGDPETIPYQFQYQLDVQYAVGRIYFETLQEYANYARNVVLAETGAVKLPRQVSLFSPANLDDPATELSTEQLMLPLHAQLSAAHADWEFTLCAREQATKSQLIRLLGGDQTPALLVTASHGMGFPHSHHFQVAHQGALLCQEWPGPMQWQGPIPQDFYFAGDDLTSSANLLGLVTFCFACYGAGTPLYDDFAAQAFKKRTAIATAPFVARLPMKMLGQSGGALAMIGHIERAWGCSFLWHGAGAQTTVFESTLARLLTGYPVGAALEYFNERYAELSTVLSMELEEIEFGKQIDPYELSSMWTANNDARGYAVLGDPAVRLPVAGVGEELQSREAIIARSPTHSASTESPRAVPNRPTPSRTTPPPAEKSLRMSLMAKKEGIQLAEGGPDVEAVSLKNARDFYASSAIYRPEYDDLTKLTVSTYMSGNLEKPSLTDRCIRTKLALDGDVDTVLPAVVHTEDAPWLQLHGDIVKQALTARLAYIRLMIGSDIDT